MGNLFRQYQLFLIGLLCLKVLEVICDESDGAAGKPYIRLVNPTTSSANPLPSAFDAVCLTSYTDDGMVFDPTWSVTNMGFAQAWAHDSGNLKVQTPLEYGHCCDENGGFFQKRETSAGCQQLKAPLSHHYPNPKCVAFMEGKKENGTFTNQATSWLDLGIVYANSENDRRKLRSMKNGKLAALKVNGEDVPPHNVQGQGCYSSATGKNCAYCMKTGDDRANQDLTMAMYHILFLRGHNRLCDLLSELNPCWDDEKLFDVARFINICYWQHILYFYWARVMIHPEKLVKAGILKSVEEDETGDYFREYDPKVQCGTSIEFALAYRVFHTTIRGPQTGYNECGFKSIQTSLSKEYLCSKTLAEHSSDFVRGTMHTPLGGNDWGYPSDIHEKLFYNQHTLLLTDILRGRNMGAPTYNAIRKHCNLPPFRKFKELLKVMPKSRMLAMKKLYKTPDEIEMIVGINAELPQYPYILGETSACIIVDQLLRNLLCDKNTYSLKDVLCPEQLKAIRGVDMTVYMKETNDNISFFRADPFKNPSPENQLIHRDEIKSFNVSAWYDPSCNAECTGM